MNKYFFALAAAVVAYFSAFNHLAAQEIMEQNPEHLYKIISQEQWEESQVQNEIVLSNADKDFIHLATEEQVAHVVQKFWKNMDYVVLMLISEKLVGRLIYESNPGGTTKYYHLYDGYIPLEAVEEAILYHANE